MSYLKTISGLVLVLFFSGCYHGKRVFYDAGCAAIGGGVSYALFDKSPLATGIGAASGSVLGHFLLGDDEQALAASYHGGYVQASSDAIKRQYWLKQEMERTQQSHAKMSYYTIPAEIHTSDGRMLVDHTITVPILE